MKLLWLVLFVTVILGCQEPVPGSCYPNPAGGAGGAGSMPIGAGVGATTSGDYDEPPKGPLGAGVGATASGDFISPPPNGPLDYGGPPNSNPCMAGQIRYFKSSDFQFVTIVADDGTKMPGGWQATNTTLIFIYEDIVSCPVGIGMPLRTELMGVISASKAARLSAGVANDVAAVMWPTELPLGIFCSKFKEKLFQEFKSQYPGLGVRPEGP